MITTEIDKYKIRSSFSKAALQYDRCALIQRETAAALLDKIAVSLPTRNSELLTLLDIGCGTGFLTHGLAKIFPKANIFGCDIAHPMLKMTNAKCKDKKIYLLTADGGVLPCKDKTFDMAASNLTYQWLTDLDAAFLETHRILRPGGIFTFSTLGPETLKELRYCYAEASARFNKDGLPPFMGFSEKQSIRSSLKNAGFKNVCIDTVEMIKTYPDMWALLNTMKSMGAGNPFKDGDKSLGRGSLLKKMAGVYKEKFGVRSSELGNQKSEVRSKNQEKNTCHAPPPDSPKAEDASCLSIYATYEVMFVKAGKGG